MRADKKVADSMASFFLTVYRLFRSLMRSLSDPEFRNISILIVMLLVSGTVFYSTVEGWRWLDSLYFSIITLSTVGYGDLSPKTDIGKIFTIVYIMVGLGLFVALVRFIADDMLAHRKARKMHKREAENGDTANIAGEDGKPGSGEEDSR